ncbi:MAG: hypothetical protein SOT34_05385, partial [Candidatus Borkfalkiaceae bacterium]|nr:hypothetical protein [Christensenellaceae bacterium]
FISFYSIFKLHRQTPVCLSAISSTAYLSYHIRMPLVKRFFRVFQEFFISCFPSALQVCFLPDKYRSRLSARLSYHFPPPFVNCFSSLFLKNFSAFSASFPIPKRIFTLYRNILRSPLSLAPTGCGQNKKSFREKFFRKSPFR